MGLRCSGCYIDYSNIFVCSIKKTNISHETAIVIDICYKKRNLYLREGIKILIAPLEHKIKYQHRGLT